MEMKGKSVLVTGAAQGIGLAIARAFAELGACVAMCDRNSDELARAGEGLRAEINDSEIATIVADISDATAVRDMVAESVRHFGTIDILVNNAGFGTMRRFWEMSDDEWQGILDTVLTGTFQCSREVTRVMLDKKTRGRIINIASTNSVIASTGISAYCAAKGGVLMFTRAAALELAPHGITVNAIGPGTTLTPLTEGFYNMPGLKEAFLDRSPMGRFGEPQDIARVVLLLASDQAEWVTGQILMADGGQSLLGLPRYMEELEKTLQGHDE